jgi:hypothetical protein
MSVVSALPVEYSFPFETISDTPIFNALAATTAPFSRAVATNGGGSAALSRSCVMPRSPRVGGGRHHRLSSHAEHVHGGGRHRLVAAAHA